MLLLLAKPRKCFACGQEAFPNPFKNGFTVPKEIGELVEQLHERPFLWWAGQFAKFTLRLSENHKKLLDEAKTLIGLSNTRHPTFGYVTS